MSSVIAIEKDASPNSKKRIKVEKNKMNVKLVDGSDLRIDSTKLRAMKNSSKGQPDWCDTQEELAKHVDTYPVHKKIVGIQKTSGIAINPDSFCGHSDMPYFISSDDIVAFSKKKSEEHYSQKRKETKNKTWLPHMPKQLNVTQHNQMMTQ
ncbi:Hypothetical predicted protein [Mytilus galloprovincialis]|uniref:Uncharacterized protein n=1 Tax=Mytilus galloprovincialis TaxID=29158 RepID=A0A8B6GX72_MYTGA|nr:Hypothetical predicted protein [Mytilus galloprovincialis]